MQWVNAKTSLITSPILFHRHFWIGASDRRQSGVYRWINGNVVTWSSWRLYTPGHPGNEPNGHSSTGLQEGCVTQNGPGDPLIKWYDFPCDYEYPSLCQSKNGKHWLVHLICYSGQILILFTNLLTCGLWAIFCYFKGCRQLNNSYQGKLDQPWQIIGQLNGEIS